VAIRISLALKLLDYNRCNSELSALLDAFRGPEVAGFPFCASR